MNPHCSADVGPDPRPPCRIQEAGVPPWKDPICSQSIARWQSPKFRRVRAGTADAKPIRQSALAHRETVHEIGRIRASSTPILPYHSARLVFIAEKKRTSTPTNPASRNKARSWRPTQGFGNPAQTLANTSRVVEASDESTIEAPRSGSVTTTRPPGRVTRASSRHAEAGSGTNARTRSARVASNVALGKSSDCALPTLICTGRPTPLNRL